jgi:OmcA/MtrC family decaheme c-type cytochrome
MNKRILHAAQCTPVLASALLMFTLSGCGSDGSDGAPGAQGPAGPPGPPGAGAAITALNAQIQSVSINSVPVVTLTVEDQDGNPITGLTASNLRYTFAKLLPPGARTSQWQNYILSAAIPDPGDPGAGAGGTPALPNGAVQGSRRNCATVTLINAAIGQYTCTFDAQDDVVANNGTSCPQALIDSGAGCKDADGNDLDLTYNANLTHRVSFEVRGSANGLDLPATNFSYTFIPATGQPPADPNDPNFNREIVKTELCNVCHDALALHGGGRVRTKHCVTCHNPGTTDPNSGRSVDFKKMIHKIHYGSELPSVNLGPDQMPDTGDEIPYIIWGYGSNPHDFSDIEFPADVRGANVATGSGLACSKCHDATQADLPQAINTLQRPSREACGACHDDISFLTGPDPDPNRTVKHPVEQLDDTGCTTCHKAGTFDPFPGSVEQAHNIWDREYAQECYQYEILDVTPQPAQGQTVTIKFRVNNPNPGKELGPDASAGRVDATCANTPVNGNTNMAHYDITTDPPFTTGGGVSRLSIDVGWDTTDINNDSSGNTTGPAKPIEINALDPLNITADNFAADGSFEVQAAIPGTATGTGRVAVEGHPAEIDPEDGVTRSIRAPVKAAILDFLIDPTPGAMIMARREPIDIIEKCDRCHQMLSLHGSNRSDEGGLCVLCHNPNNTDIAARALHGPPPYLDGKTEESLDFKRMIHGIHAAAASNFDGTNAHGFRENGMVIYGYGGSEHDFSHIRFPGALDKCETCHVDDSYILSGIWEAPAQNGILGSTIESMNDFDHSNDLKISPTAAVCSACHDSELAKSHMLTNGALFAATQAAISANVEACATCHGPGKIASVELVHQGEFGEDIP